jgi:hypothetical protein
MSLVCWAVLPYGAIKKGDRLNWHIVAPKWLGSGVFSNYNGWVAVGGDLPKSPLKKGDA